MTFVEIILAIIVFIWLAAFLGQILWRAKQSPEQGKLNGWSLIGFVFVAAGAILAFTVDIWTDWLALAFVIVGIVIEIVVFSKRNA